MSTTPADLYRAVFEQAADGIFIAHQDGKSLADVNAAGHALLGYPLGELPGQLVTNIVSAGQSSKLESVISRITQGSRLLENFRLTRKDGTTFSAEVMAQRLPDGRLMAMARDLTERLQVEDRIRTSEAHLRSILETAPSSLLTVDRQGRILFTNRVLPTQTMDQVIGALCFNFVPSAYHARVARAIEHVFETREIDEYEIEALIESGKPGWWYVRVGPIIENGEVKAVIMCATDVTLLKQTETARAKLETQLRQTQKEDGIGRLAGGVAHDFNNLLTSILGFASLIERHLPPSSPGARFLEELVLSTQRGAALTHQLLAFARQKVVSPEVVNLNEIVRKMRGMLEPLIGEDVRLVLDLRSKNSRVKVDVGSMEQVVLNLAVNARDAMPRGGTLRITTEDVELDKAQGLAGQPSQVEIMKISDTGVGMTPEVLEQAFEPFFTTKPTGASTGLGLSMCQGIIRQAGGHITVSSAPGQGSTFEIHLPRAKGEASGKSLARIAKPVTAPVTGGSETLLIVEDDALIRRVTSEILVNLGYNILTAADGEEALQVISGLPDCVDLVITDVVMPNMGGNDLAYHLAQLAPSTRVLFTSGYPEHAIARQGVLHEGIDFIQKPYAPTTLAAKVRAVLDRA